MLFKVIHAVNRHDGGMKMIRLDLEKKKKNMFLT